jgi:NADH-quinone oxidoreductase subunit N
MILTAPMLCWKPTSVFCNTYAIDGFATVFKLLLELGALISTLIVAAYFKGHSQVAQAPVAIVFSTLGGIALVSSLDLGLIVLSLQLLSIASYLLVGLVRSNKEANEATLKYFIYAATALAVMAYGLTFLYGLTGSLDLRAIGKALVGADRIWVAVGLGLVLVGYAFEITMVPLHFWAPDVYQGATAPITGFLSVVPKIAGFAGLLRFILLAFPGGLANWPLVIAAIAVLTMTLGNLVALRQDRLKRLLAYSSIAQAGYVLIAVAVADRVDSALAASGYYLATYLFMNLGAFLVVAQIERATGSDTFKAASGLSQWAPGSAAVLALSLLSLAGIPPLAGFAGKVFLLKATLQGGLGWLAAIAVVNMALGLYYYVIVIAEMYLKPPSQSVTLPTGGGYTFAIVLGLSGTFILGILPAPALNLMQLLSNLLR